MPTPAESLCCREIDEIAELLKESGQHCVTQCDRFESVCLNADVLVTVAGLLCEQQASRLENPISNRYAVYCQPC
jgi:hypothetical protein